MSSVIRSIWRYCFSCDWARDLIAFCRVKHRKAEVIFYCDHAINIYVIKTAIEELELKQVSYLVLIPCVADNDCFPDNRRVRISNRFARVFMKFLRCKVFVTPASGLSREIMPRRAIRFVHFSHSIVSLHMIYQDGSFDGYDTILACGAHQVREIKAMNRLKGIADRQAVLVGYGKIDIQLRWKRDQEWASPHHGVANKTVLIAPSWGRNNIVESMGMQLVSRLREAGFGVTLRPHLGILRNNSDAVAAIRERFKSDKGFTFEGPSEKSASFFYSDVMISDYSGVAFEYAFVMERPVVFVEVPVKVFNKDYSSVGIDPIELKERENLGLVCGFEVEEVVKSCCRLMIAPEECIASIRDCRSRILTNFGRAGKAAADGIEKLLLETTALNDD